ncbi:MAG TPA: FGGY family carbohydrate kinase [Actinophytocola sp.]|uniref:FGGY-family carbohydrate kinase n=1 Tax=Actinophytocola sp. TaxID=1872138 RepID=UPI002DDD5D60|nr:FGGY family carbohydrate kinase [Actinophytocola sp.]HEV2783916.1 FGGY family carbohydrate kinase [Actinophytocola sp.]
MIVAGIDVGSTSCKVGIYTAAGNPVAQARRPTGDDCDALVAGVLADLEECVERAGAAPAAVGITSMAESGVALDDRLRPMHPLLRWDDPRGAEEARLIEAEVGRAALFARTGVHLGAKTPLARWSWLRRHRPEVLGSMRVWVNAADLVATALLGAPVTDRTLAGRTGALDQRAGEYDPELLAASGVRPGQLPRIADGIAGRVSGAHGGLRGGTPVVIAGHDHLVAAYAAGARAPGATVDSLGTAEAVVTVSARPPDAGTVDGGLSWNRHADGRHWALVSGFPGSGRLLEWAAERLLGAARPEAFRELVRDVRRPTGIVVEPYLSGRGAPAPDPGRRLTMRGVTAAHGAAELAVAVLEGACLHVRWMAEAHGPLGECVVLGGPARNQTWMAIKAEVMPWPVRRCAAVDAAGVGAALLAGRAIGFEPPVLPSERLPRDGARAARYQKIYTDEFLREATR